MKEQIEKIKENSKQEIMKCENTKNENIGNTNDVNVKIKKTFEMILGITLDYEDFIKYEENFIKSKMNEL